MYIKHFYLTEEVKLKERYLESIDIYSNKDWDAAYKLYTPNPMMYGPYGEPHVGREGKPYRLDKKKVHAKIPLMNSFCNSVMKKKAQTMWSDVVTWSRCHGNNV